MKRRTIEEVKSKEFGHRKFALFCNLAKIKNHTIEDIKEFNEKFKFKMDGEPVEFDKNPKVSYKAQLEWCETLLKYRKWLKEKID